MSKLRSPEDFDYRGYFEWLCQKVNGDKSPYDNFHLLLGELHSESFSWVLDRDRNRALDGIDLRQQYADIYGEDVTQEVMNIPCTVLEMLVALSIDIDDQIMGQPGGPQYGRWFWMMIDNLHLYSQDDSRFDRTYVSSRLSDFMYRRISKNGEGGLFPMKHAWEDQRMVEIWQQAADYLTPYTVIL